jgi:hypothetical protein
MNERPDKPRAKPEDYLIYRLPKASTVALSPLCGPFLKKRT